MRALLPRQVGPAITLLILLTFVAAAATASTGSVQIDPELEEEIRILGSHVWDQSMARRFGQDLELPTSEAIARFEIVERWLEVLRDQDAELPDGFEGRMKPVSDVVTKSRGGADVDLDPVLLFLEQEFEGLAKASGLEIAPPNARGN